MKLVLLFLFSWSVLFGHVATTENDPSSLIEGIVSAITGDLYVVEEDIVVQGGEPLRITRTYDSRGEWWNVFKHLHLTYFYGSPIIQILEPNGTMLTYHFKEGFFRCVDFEGLANTATGEISARTNLKNQYATLNKHRTKVALFAADGTKRTYRADKNHFKEKFGTENLYFLESEEFLNRTSTLYEWTNDGRPKKISKTDSKGSPYTSISINHHGKVKKHNNQSYLDNQNCDLFASDQRALKYTFFHEDKKEKAKWFLRTIDSSDDPSEEIHYREGTKQRPIDAISLPENRILKVEYYSDGKVKTLTTPAGTTTITITMKPSNLQKSRPLTLQPFLTGKGPILKAKLLKGFIPLPTNMMQLETLSKKPL